MNAHIYENPTVFAGTIARTVVLALALTNQVLSALGKPVLPIESAQLEQIVTTGITRYRKGYPVLIRCPDLVQTQPDRLQALHKEIYMPVADNGAALEIR